MVSATDCLISVIKQLQDAITKHKVIEATNEEKAINTLWELLTAPSTTPAHAQTTLVPKTTCPSTNIAVSALNSYSLANAAADVMDSYNLITHHLQMN